MLEYRTLINRCMKYTIYKITNKVNNKIYIGCHKTLDLDDGYMGSGKLIGFAIFKYGKENFTKEYLHIFDNAEEMFDMEATLVNEEFVVDKETYNIMQGGTGGFDYVNANYDRTTTKYKESCSRGGKKSLELHGDRIASLGGKASWEAKKNNPDLNMAHFAGKKHTAETKRKIGEANSKHQTGNKNSQYGKMWITNGIESKTILKTDSIPEGFRKGRVIKNLTTTK